jgi:ferredoxin
LPRASPEEEDMLDLAESLSATSRLGCQLRLDEALDGLTVTVPKTSLLD